MLGKKEGSLAISETGMVRAEGRQKVAIGDHKRKPETVPSSRATGRKGGKK